MKKDSSQGGVRTPCTLPLDPLLLRWKTNHSIQQKIFSLPFQASSFTRMIPYRDIDGNERIGPTLLSDVFAGFIKMERL